MLRTRGEESLEESTEESGELNGDQQNDWPKKSFDFQINTTKEMLKIST